jgi:hypothetical protein
MTALPAAKTEQPQSTPDFGGLRGARFARLVLVCHGSGDLACVLFPQVFLIDLAQLN